MGFAGKADRCPRPLVRGGAEPDQVDFTAVLPRRQWHSPSADLEFDAVRARAILERFYDSVIRSSAFAHARLSRS